MKLLYTLQPLQIILNFWSTKLTKIFVMIRCNNHKNRNDYVNFQTAFLLKLIVKLESESDSRLLLTIPKTIRIIIVINKLD